MLKQHWIILTLMRKDIRASDRLSLALHWHNIFPTTYCFVTYLFLLPTNLLSYLRCLVHYYVIQPFLLTTFTIEIISTAICTRQNRYRQLGTYHIHFYVIHFKLLKTMKIPTFRSRFNIIIFVDGSCVILFHTKFC